ncbi:MULTISPECIES: AraC family transcriptional regulator [Gordonia]|uniref:AraC family transcriptional regulator n=2 Tax=Gordonia terrae TaxID=2055 RepID=A0AAD0NZ92_9ACTN|nr:AraC family transcriptional regulator [Gordonia terrae]VTR07975.1 DNA-binding domain-containing protein [Clostridioides difficile]ANY25121.1 AraC family transcriptional regulator [Gordonia terrae]AWO85868.1 AraC family transcriptional regulator [Gordonia terrae]UPW08710.1 AraC family transcriptional regulator [Gordonia terrae]VTS61779.1 Arabinose operon regulatory protein [Gordonia terrae]
MTANAPMDDSACTAGTVELSTRELASAEGRVRWAEALDATFCEMDIDWPQDRRPFTAQIVARPVGSLSVSVVRADPHTVVRTPAMIESDPADDYLLCLITQGAATISQGEHTGLLQHGAFGIIDATAPFVVSGATEFEQIVVRAPRGQLAARATYDVIDDATGRAIAVDSGIGRLVSSFLVDVAAQVQGISVSSSGTVASAVLDMVAGAVTEQISHRTATDRIHAADLRAVQNAMADHLHDPDHTIALVAAEVGMSMRYVHKLFSTTGTTPRAWLYARRLDRARALLAQTDLCVADICAQVGFRDASHFSRAFSRTFGVSPSRYRATAPERHRP